MRASLITPDFSEITFGPDDPVRGSQCLTCGASCGSETDVLKLRAVVDLPGSDTCVGDLESAARGHPGDYRRPEGEGGSIWRLRRTRWHCCWCRRAGGLVHHSSCHCRQHGARPSPSRCASRTHVAQSDTRRSVCIFASTVLLACAAAEVADDEDDDPRSCCA